jgi:predicted nuclease of restriction endonuclease-like (RecB) superfamily
MAETPSHSDFQQLSQLIRERRTQVLRHVNRSLIDLYWEVGKILSRKIEDADWGKGTVAALADFLQKEHPGLRGFSASNLWRMRQLYETYRGNEKLASLVRELPWSSNLLILGRAKTEEAREFYLRMAVREQWSRRALNRQLEGSLFERTLLTPAKLAPAVRELHPAAAEAFKDAYLVDFLDLPDSHSEKDLHQGLLKNLSLFLAELGRDFCFIGSEHPLQVGNQDFSLDLLFYHRELNCLVAIELKITAFDPAHLGQLNFYLEALDRDVRKPHENPSIGILLCASKDDEVVEYALSRSLSPALVAEYQTKLPDKALLQAKLHEFLALEAECL